MGDALHTPGAVVSAADARLAQAGLYAVQGGLINPRTGVLWGPGSTALIAGTSDTAPMRVAIAAHHWLTNRGSDADGVYAGAAEAVQHVNIGAAPGSGTRVDTVWVKQNDSSSTITPDGTTEPVYGVTPGTPTKQPIPVGAEELGTVSVSAGATRTDGAGVTITNTARQTVARGADIPVRSQAERDALAAAWGSAPGVTVKRLDLGGRVERWNGSRWTTPGAGDVTLGVGFYAGTGDLALTASPGWTDIATVTATSAGGECVASWVCTLANGNSGLDRTGSFRVVCDATQLGSIGPVTMRLAGLQPQTRAGAYASTPGAGAHTWKLQANGSAAAAVVAQAGLLTVIEKG